MQITEHDIESLDGFQNADKLQDWRNHDPGFQWTAEDLEEFDLQERTRNHELEAMAGWWEMEGVRCMTFNRNPTQNPYREILNEMPERDLPIGRMKYDSQLR